MNGLPADALVGKRVRHPDAVAALERVLATGEPVLNVELAVDGRRFEASYFPVRAGGDSPVAVGAAVYRRRGPPARARTRASASSTPRRRSPRPSPSPTSPRPRWRRRAPRSSPTGPPLLLVRGDWLELIAIDGPQRPQARPALAGPAHGAASQRRGGAHRPGGARADPGGDGGALPGARSTCPRSWRCRWSPSGEPLGVLLIDFTRPRTLDADERGLLERARDAVRDRARPRAALRARARRRADAAGLAAPARAAGRPGPGPRGRLLAGAQGHRGRRRLLRRVRDRRRRVGRRDRRRVRQGRRRRRADRARPPHRARRRRRGRSPEPRPARASTARCSPRAGRASS